MGEVITIGLDIAKSVSRDEAFLIAVNIAKLPSVPRPILKDIHGRQIRPAGMIEWPTVSKDASRANTSPGN
jgi:hypothetical protein